MSSLVLQTEINFILFLQSLGAWLHPIMSFFTFLGSEYVYLVLLPMLYWCVDASLGLRTGVMLMLSVGTGNILKMAFHTPRPYWVDARVEAFSSETSFGLPSGHSTNAVGVWGTVARGFKKKGFTILMAFIMFMIGISRMYLGVHFLRDVLTGWLLGGLLLLGLSLFDKPFTRWISSLSLRSQVLFCVGISAAFLAAGFAVKGYASTFTVPETWISQAYAASGVYPDPFSMEGLVTISGVFLGFSTGFAWLTKKLSGIRVDGNLQKRVARFLLGVATVGLIYLLLKWIAPTDPGIWSLAFRFLRYGLLGFWVAAGAPLLFRKLNLDR